MRERRLDAVGGVVAQRQRDGAGGRDGAVVGEARTVLGERRHQLRLHLGDLLHVAAVAGVQDAARHLVAHLVAILLELGALAHHPRGDLVVLVECRSHALLAGEFQGLLPALDGQVAAHLLGEGQRLGRAVGDLEHGQGGAQAQEAHAVATLGLDLAALARQRQAADLHHVVEHAGEDRHHLAVALPVEAGLLAEGVDDEAGQVDRAEQAGALRRQRLLPAGVGGADLLTEPVVVHPVDLIDQDEARLGEVVGRLHDGVPQLAGLDHLDDAAGHAALGVDGVALFHHRPVAVEQLALVDVLLLALVEREGQRPVGVLLHRFHELVGDQQAEVELAQAPRLALGLDELAHVGVTDIEGAHLGAAAPAGGGHREAHLVVDIHERQGAVGAGPGAEHEGALVAQGGEVVADAAARLEGHAGIHHRVEDVVHGVADGARHRAVDQAHRRLVGLGAGVGHDAPGGDGPVLQRPAELRQPLVGLVAFHRGQGTGHPLPGGGNVLVHGLAVAVLEAVLGIPDVAGGGLQGHLVG